MSSIADETGSVNASCSGIEHPAAWRKCAPAFCSLKDIMSETLANELHQKEVNSPLSCHSGCSVIEAMKSHGPDLLPCGDLDTSNDVVIAHMLQSDFDAEHNQQLKHVEDKLNGSNKVKITFDNYKMGYADLPSDSASESQEVPESEVRNDYMTHVKPQFSRSGFRGKGKNIVTKHDATLCGRQNAMKIMENFPPDFETGDSGNLDISLSNVVFNQLLVHSKSESKRSQRLHERKEHSTAEQAVDPKTRLALYKIVNGGLLNAINGVISCGKESVVFHAYGGSRPNEVIPAECAVKVFKTSLNKFHNRCQYVRGDVRFFKDEFKKHNPRKIMAIWAEKEMINLQRMKKFDIPCPSVILLKKHILVMSFVGSSQIPAPKLRDAHLSQTELQYAYGQCVQHMRTLYKDCLLVHADLSEYNILWWQNQVYFIDVAQAVDVMHPHALQFLIRDCENVSKFFERSGLVGLPDKFKLFSSVTDLDLAGKEPEFFSQIEQYEKDERFMQLGWSKTDYPFEYFFSRTCAERASQQPDGSSSSDEIDATCDM